MTSNPSITRAILGALAPLSIISLILFGIGSLVYARSHEGGQGVSVLINSLIELTFMGIACLVGFGMFLLIGAALFIWLVSSLCELRDAITSYKKHE